jgi:hypothetical protein
MMIVIQRQILTSLSTIGSLVVNELQCATLEDPVRAVKIWGHTAIPAGTYVLKLRTEGPKYEQYLARFGPDFHKGMLWLQDIPNFTDVYIHIGNTPADTEGCILVGTGQATDSISNSEVAYRAIYPSIAAAILAGDDVMVDVLDPMG